MKQAETQKSKHGFRKYRWNKAEPHHKTQYGLVSEPGGGVSGEEQRHHSSLQAWRLWSGSQSDNPTPPTAEPCVRPRQGLGSPKNSQSSFFQHINLLQSHPSSQTECTAVGPTGDKSRSW